MENETASNHTCIVRLYLMTNYIFIVFELLCNKLNYEFQSRFYLKNFHIYGASADFE